MVDIFNKDENWEDNESEECTATDEKVNRTK